MNWNIDNNSRISRLPKALHIPALVARNFSQAYTKAFQPLKGYSYIHDGIATRHNCSYMHTPFFERAYARAVRAHGSDLQIHWRLHQALWCSKIAQGVNGDFVEMGTARGFMMSGVLEDFTDWNHSNRSMHLFDTFISSTPDERGIQDPNGAKNGYYATSADSTIRNFSEWANVIVHEGYVQDTLPKASISSIAFAHIDLNFAEAEVFGLKFIWPHIAKGGVILLDDYAHAQHLDQYRAMNALASDLQFSILSTPTGQGIIIKT